MVGLADSTHPTSRPHTMPEDPQDADFVTVAKVGAIPDGEGASFQVGDRLVAVFNYQGQYLAIDDLCPHMGASLGAGYLDEEGVVTCPWHAWRFNVCNGKWADNPAAGGRHVRRPRRGRRDPGAQRDSDSRSDGLVA